MKNAYTIEDLMEANGKSRATIYRWRKKKIICEPDVDNGSHPIWYRETLLKNMPNLIGSESNLTTSPSV